MAQSIQPGRFGHIGGPDDAWLAKQEDEQVLEPELPIIDTHHHLWDRNGWIYLLPELLADLNTGHNIVATVFEECRSMYRSDDDRCIGSAVMAHEKGDVPHRDRGPRFDTGERAGF